MHESKHIAALVEVREAIDEALKDQRGLLPRQRRLMSMLSLGTQHLIEVWLHKNGAIKPGASVKHEWFKSEGRNLRMKLTGIVTKDVGKLVGSEKVLALAREVERDRNDIVYGAPLPNDRTLKEKIDAVLELKKAVEEATGEIRWG